MTTTNCRSPFLLLCSCIFIFVITGYLAIRQTSYTLNLSNSCQMTYSWPVYTPLEFDGLNSSYQIYALHMKYATDVKKPNGIPIIFVPGHLGSYQQARSFGRHAYDVLQSKSLAFKPKLDYYTIDFNEETSGLNGDIIWSQAYYLNQGIQEILGLYEHMGSKHSPQSVILLAHSMGGILARTIYLLPNYKLGSVLTIISLSSPHLFPTYPFDRSLNGLYDSINVAWGASIDEVEAILKKSDKEICSSKEQNLESNSDAIFSSASNSLANVSIVSISGGFRDILVLSSSSSLNGIAHPLNSFTALTSSLEYINTSVDHFCLVWCKQLLKSITLGIVEMINPNTSQPYESPYKRLSSLQRYLKLKSTKENQANNLQDEVVSKYLIEFMRVYALLLIPLSFIILTLILSTQIFLWQNQFNENISVIPKYLSLYEGLHPKYSFYYIFNLMKKVSSLPYLASYSSLSSYSFFLLLLICSSLTAYYSSFNNLFNLAEYLFLYPLSLGFLSILVLLLTTITTFTKKWKNLDKKNTRNSYLLLAFFIFLLTFTYGHIISTDFSFTIEKELSLIYFCFLEFHFSLLFSLIFISGKTKNLQNYQITVFLLYLLVIPCILGEMFFYHRFLNGFLALNKIDFFFKIFSSLLLILPMTFHLLYIRVSMVPLPSIVSLTSLKHIIEWIHVMKYRNFVSINKCTNCFYEDGGKNAIYEEIIKESKNSLFESQFRVISCDCSVHFPNEESYCDFCKRHCNICGGSTLAQKKALSYISLIEELEFEIQCNLIIPILLGIVALFVLLFSLSKGHRLLYAADFIAIILSVYHRIYQSSSSFSLNQEKNVSSEPLMYEIQQKFNKKTQKEKL